MDLLNDVQHLDAVFTLQPVTWALLSLVYRELRRSARCEHCGNGHHSPTRGGKARGANNTKPHRDGNHVDAEDG